jgi:hypothetical protein
LEGWEVEEVRMRSVTVLLSDAEDRVHEYQVRERRSAGNREWRKLLEEHFQGVAGALESEISSGQDLAALVRGVGGTLLGSVDIVTELVRDYAPSLPLDAAYDSEILDAFTGVLGLAYPFGSTIARLAGALGRANPQT